MLAYAAQNSPQLASQRRRTIQNHAPVDFLELDFSESWESFSFLPDFSETLAASVVDNQGAHGLGLVNDALVNESLFGGNITGAVAGGPLVNGEARVFNAVAVHHGVLTSVAGPRGAVVEVVSGGVESVLVQVVFFDAGVAVVAGVATILVPVVGDGDGARGAELGAVVGAIALLEGAESDGGGGSSEKGSSNESHLLFGK